MKHLFLDCGKKYYMASHNEIQTIILVIAVIIWHLLLKFGYCQWIGFTRHESGG